MAPRVLATLGEGARGIGRHVDAIVEVPEPEDEIMLEHALRRLDLLIASSSAAAAAALLGSLARQREGDALQQLRVLEVAWRC